jgi:hypothetical protein
VALGSPASQTFAADDPAGGGPKPSDATPAVSSVAAAPDDWRKLDSVPARFSRVTDRLGCRWGLNADGDIGLSNSADQQIEAFEFGVALRVNNKEFKSTVAEVDELRHAFRLRGPVDGVTVARHIWIDSERGGARYVEGLTNSSSEEKKLRVAIETQFDERIETLVDASGRAMTPGLKNRESAAGVIQEGESGRAGVIYLLADARSELRPGSELVNEGKRLVFVWDVTLAANETVSILHWVLQRPGLTADQVKPALQNFFRNGRLLRPQLDETLARTLANFPGASWDDDHSASAEAMLAGLKKLCERLSIERGDEDIYWMGANSILAGQVQGDPLIIESRFGKQTLPLAEIAAVQGAAGRGRLPRVFLRDGTVLTGALTLPEWKVSGTKGWTITLTPEALDAVVMKRSPADGVVAPAPAFLAVLNSGEVLPLQLGAGEKLALTSPWGAVEAAMNEIVAFHHLKQPTPVCRLWLTDGSKLTVFPGHRDFTAQSPRFGALTLNIGDLAAIWQPSKEVPDFTTEPEEIQDLETIEGSFCLLKGSNLVAGQLANDSLTFISGATETVVKPADVRLLKRIDGGNDLAPLFHLELVSGGQFDGVLRIASLKIKTSAGLWDVPVAHAIAIKRHGGP